ncbi:DmpA family aminopeptidase [Maricaulis virginensis]|uniref:D-aminopeptidase n=1 Tax=Maricaulis virginensis TaxID=144022 RepID=A0A9W6IN61_9PROT|nr:P1 family peptidase [Maricaulis virginensis]GLK52026.1 D-aminopeptidase [Maricaulis virginensis]
MIGAARLAGLAMAMVVTTAAGAAQERGPDQVRAREIGIAPGVLTPGPLNAITDVEGVRVGQVTLTDAEAAIRTGVTAILPHGGDLYADKVPAALAVGNGYGKLMGATQIRELGEIETPIVLTNTLAVPRAADGILDWSLALPGHEGIRSLNMVVGETNDSRLNDIRARIVTPEHAVEAIESASDGPVAEGNVGAGNGTVTFGWKGGIGTSSRRLPEALGGWTLGVLVQTNYGGILQMDGLPVGETLGQYYLSDHVADDRADGSIMIVLATDAPLSDRNLERLARRTFAGLARTGASITNGSGDYALAFSTHPDVRRTPERRSDVATISDLPNGQMSPLFQAAIEATEEAIYNALLMAEDIDYPVAGSDAVVHALPVERVRAMVEQRHPRP